MAVRVSPGLVPSINNAETLDVDRVQARCTRMRKQLGVAAKFLSQGVGTRAWMLTFTYRDDVEWTASQVREALTHLRKWLKRTHKTTLRYVWVLETKARKTGARIGEQRPHYHCVVWVPSTVTKEQLQFDSRGWWPHGFTNAVEAVAAVRYVMKYVSKFDGPSAFPKGARVYGVGGLDDIGRGCRRWVAWPRFVQARASASCPWRRAAGGGWLDGSTGEIWPSEWGIRHFIGNSTRLVRLRTHPPTGFEPEGPFSWITAGAAAAA